MDRRIPAGRLDPQLPDLGTPYEDLAHVSGGSGWSRDWLIWLGRSIHLKFVALHYHHDYVRFYVQHTYSEDES